MTVSTYGNLQDNAQSTVHGIVNADSIVQGFTKNIVDGVPEGLTRGVGFPYVVIPTPTVSEERLTFTLKKVFVEFPIEIWTTRESVCRKLSDAVRNTLKTNLSTTEAAYLKDFNVTSSGVSPTILPDGKTVYTNIIRVRFEWIGSGG